ncbi:hypothetical protein XENORESO_006928 [Xenotaenia resolanae]|uniref:FZ domain-containing protein n=1 Tax=Xenotaenia resolanae TaxID=208358 RepID=A0ABV0VWX0_9TELE
MLFGCSLALPECLEADGTNSRRVLLPCASFCEAAREGCEPVLQMFNASWPDFLRCSQFSKNTSSLSTPASPSSPSSLSSSSPLATTGLTPPACFTPRQIKGKPSVCGGKDNFLCATGICVPQKLVCNGYNDCDDWSDETHCECPEEEFRCNTGRCLSPALVCDGYNDCGDLSDELNCGEKTQTCPPETPSISTQSSADCTHPGDTPTVQTQSSQWWYGKHTDTYRSGWG